MTLKFMGREFDGPYAFRQAFPAFAAPDAVRAVQAGCQSPTEVEIYCWRRRQKSYQKARDGAHKSPFRETLANLAKAPKRRSKA
ncbi:hypothetical protein [Marilutibacter spongiae]|uniref:Uncharacterized protein n=1 Tax=Marilutibacter spongiae TaxID=2025720 RepID=A0A7W3TL94_9GAMM|nr:hypothetical protein [Lysobacter spongiae]MBB1060402.1 hypothetical protein [Lysobacter spongiae]